MIDFEGSAVVERPIEEVFAFVANPTNIPSYQDKVISTEITSKGTLGEGTQFLETVQMGPGKMHVSCVVTAYDAPRRVAFSARGSMVHCDAEYVFEAAAGGTRVHIKGGRLAARGVAPQARVETAMQPRSV